VCLPSPSRSRFIHKSSLSPSSPLPPLPWLAPRAPTPFLPFPVSPSPCIPTLPCSKPFESPRASTFSRPCRFIGAMQISPIPCPKPGSQNALPPRFISNRPRSATAFPLHNLSLSPRRDPFFRLLNRPRGGVRQTRRDELDVQGGIPASTYPKMGYGETCIETPALIANEDPNVYTLYPILRTYKATYSITGTSSVYRRTRRLLLYQHAPTTLGMPKPSAQR
jgi:hypothetical protein